VGALGLAAAAVTLAMLRGRQEPVIRAIIPQPPNELFLFAGDNAGPPVISPDGRRVAFVAVDSERGARLWIRDVSSLTARPLNGTEAAPSPFWPRETGSRGFSADGRLKRVARPPGQVFAFSPAPAGRGGPWNRRDEIVFSPDFWADLQVVSAAGGTPRTIVT